MSRFRTCVLAALASVTLYSQASAVPVAISWSTTASSISGDPLPPGVSLGDPVTMTVIVDNGNTSLLSQSWVVGDLISAILDVDGGAYTYTRQTLGGAGSFQTDGAGNVIAVPVWQALDSAAYSDSLGNNEANSGSSGYFINGANQLYGIFNTNTPGGLIAISSPNVSDNQVPANWSAAFAQVTVPEPATAGLALLAIAGLSARRQRVA